MCSRVSARRPSMSSSVARSTIVGMMPSSKTSRASVTSTAVTGARLMRSARPAPRRSEEGVVTKAPPRAPTRISTRPPASRMRRASRTVTRLTPMRSQSSRSEGSRSPGRSRLVRMRVLIWSTIASDMRLGETAVNMPSRFASAAGSETTTRPPPSGIAPAALASPRGSQRLRWITNGYRLVGQSNFPYRGNGSVRGRCGRCHRGQWPVRVELPELAGAAGRAERPVPAGQRQVEERGVVVPPRHQVGGDAQVRGDRGDRADGLAGAAVDALVGLMYIFRPPS